MRCWSVGSIKYAWDKTYYCWTWDCFKLANSLIQTMKRASCLVQPRGLTNYIVLLSVANNKSTLNLQHLYHSNLPSKQRLVVRRATNLTTSALKGVEMAGS